MKKLLLLTSLMFVCLHLSAGQRTIKEMKETAHAVLNCHRNRAGRLDDMKEYLSLSKLTIYGYENGGFVVVTSDNRFEPVIGVSASQFSDTIPCGFRWWMETVNANMEVANTAASIRRSRKNGSSVAPLLTTNWGQERPFNDSCTFTNSNRTYKCVTGCVATALAQVMNFHQYPECGTGSIAYDVTYNNSFTITFSEDFSQSVYDWNNMLDSYEAYYKNKTVDVHTQAVAKLMKDCGVATKTRFSDSTNGSSSSLYQACEALKTYFNYDSSTRLFDRSDYSKDEWLDIIYNEITNGRPVIYSGKDNESITSMGHAFVLNGYDSAGKVYVNWGWDGRYEGYYDIDLLNPSSHKYDYYQSMVVVVPPVTPNFHDITISASGSGSVNYARYNGAQVREGTEVFRVREGNNVSLFFVPDMGYQIKKVKINGVDVTSSISDGQYTITNAQSSATVDVEFEEKVGYTHGAYNLYITCIGESISRTTAGSSVTTTLKFTITNTGSETVDIKKLIVKSADNSTVLYSNTDTNVLGKLNGDSSRSLSLRLGRSVSEMPLFELEYIYNGESYAYIASKYHVLSIKTNKYGSVTFSGVSINNTTKKFSIEPMGEVVLDLTPYEGCMLDYLKHNDSDVTSNVVDNKYLIQNITQNNSIEATFKISNDENSSIGGHEYVDLGLTSGKCWSTVNYDAELPEEPGSYLSDYRISSIKSNWGEYWQTPSKEEFQELIDECEWTWTTRNGKNGYSIKGPNGNTVFLPAAGGKNIISMSGVGTKLNYWTSTEGSFGIYKWVLQGSASSYRLTESSTTFDEYPVRPISTYTPTVVIETIMEEDKAKTIFSIDGRPLETLHRGLNIIRMNNGSVKKVIIK